MRRRKRAREQDRALSSSSNPYRPITSEIPNKSIKLDKKRSIKLLDWNANSITGKLNKKENLIIEENPNIVSLNETRTN